MINKSLEQIELERAAEQLRQERETFNQRKRQSSRWFFLRLVMGYVTVFLLMAILLFSGYQLYLNETFPDYVVVSLIAVIWKFTLKPS